MLVTINTDASDNSWLKIGAYAFYIVCNQGVIKRSGRLTESKGSTDAEFKCICNALYSVYKSGFTGVNRIIINTDALTISNIVGKPHKIKPDSVAEKFLSIIDLIKTKYGIPQGIQFYEFRHVKGHTDSKKPRALSNKWCDQEARRIMREFSKELTKKKAETV